MSWEPAETLATGVAIGMSIAAIMLATAAVAVVLLARRQHRKDAS